jgi:hypothetical protein
MDREQNVQSNFGAAAAFGVLLTNAVLLLAEGLTIWHHLPRYPWYLRRYPSLLWLYGPGRYNALTLPYLWAYVTVPTYTAFAVDLGVAAGAEALRRGAVLPGRASGFLALRLAAQTCAALHLALIAGIALFTPHFSLI